MAQDPVDGRQGILEFPKQIAALIHNRISESVDRVFPTPPPEGQAPPPDPVTPVSGSPRPPPRTREPHPPKPPPSVKPFGQVILENFRKSTAPPLQLPPVTLEPEEIQELPTSAPTAPLAPLPAASAPLNPAEVEEYIYLIRGTTTTPRPIVTAPQVTPDPEDFDPGVATDGVDPEVDESTTTLPEDVDTDSEPEDTRK